MAANQAVQSKFAERVVGTSVDCCNSTAVTNLRPNL